MASLRFWLTLKGIPPFAFYPRKSARFRWTEGLAGEILLSGWAKYMPDEMNFPERFAALRGSVLVWLYLEELKEIECHKWLLSEKVGFDIGWDFARCDWKVRHYPRWRQHKIAAFRLQQN